LENLNKVIKEHRFLISINFAAETHVDRSIHGGCKDFVLTNTGHANDFRRGTEIENRKVCQCVTDEVYGRWVGRRPKSRNTPHLPNMPYAAAKAGGV